MDSYKHLILGGGMVAGYAVQQFLEDGVSGEEIGVISADNAPPYERPPLSKGFLKGEEKESSVYINPPADYKKKGIALHLETHASSVDTASKQVITDKGAFGYDQLLIATGAVVRTLDVPGADNEGIFYLRSLDDSKRIAATLKPAKSAVIVGSGFIGMEVASAYAQKDTETTMVFPESRLWEHFLSPEISDFFKRYYEERGVKLVPGDLVEGFSGEGGKLKAVQTKNGKELPAEAVVAGVGVKPVTDFLEGSGLKVDNGITVNEYLETGVPGVWAAGDVASYWDVLYEKQRRIEHWDNAVEQGKHVAKEMASGKAERFEHVPYFFSDVFDLSYEYWGDSAGADQIIHRADWDKGSINGLWLKDGRLVAAFVLNRPDEERDLVQEWIREKTDLTPARDKLADTGKKLSAVL